MAAAAALRMACKARAEVHGDSMDEACNEAGRSQSLVPKTDNKRGCIPIRPSPRQTARLIVNSNKRQATLNGRISGAAFREIPFLPAATLFLTHVHPAHCARNALQRIKKRCFATSEISVNRPKYILHGGSRQVRVVRDRCNQD